MQAKDCNNIFLAGDSTSYQEPDQHGQSTNRSRAEETAAKAVEGT